MEFTAAKEIRC